MPLHEQVVARPLPIPPNMKAKPICLRLAAQAILSADWRARIRTGESSAANRARMAITTSNSINVQPGEFLHPDRSFTGSILLYH